jgi:cytochrome P450
MSPTDLLHNMQFFIVAGHETTALALSWSLLLLALHPEAQERAQAEARAALGDSPAGASHMEATPGKPLNLRSLMLDWDGPLISTWVFNGEGYRTGRRTRAR